jgi:hypothetical protein
MAGYLFSLNNISFLEESITNGVYSTIMNILSNGIWRVPHKGTCADYML